MKCDIAYGGKRRKHPTALFSFLLFDLAFVYCFFLKIELAQLLISSINVHVNHRDHAVFEGNLLKQLVPGFFQDINFFKQQCFFLFAFIAQLQVGYRPDRL